MFLLLAGLAALVVIYHYLIKPHTYWTAKGVKQTSSVFIARDSWGLLTRTQTFPDMVCDAYNACPNTRYSGVYKFFIPTLILNDPELIKQITVKDFDYFLDHRPYIPAEANPFWANNLLALTGQKWTDMRATVSPVFTSSKMKHMFVLISECAEHFVNHFFNKKEEVVTVEMKDIFTRFTNDVIATTAFGIKFDSLEEPNNEFYTMGKKLTNFVGLWKNLKFFIYLIFPKIATFFKLGLICESDTGFFVKLVKQTIETREKHNIIRPDLIHTLMEARKNGIKYEENNDATVDAGFAVVKESEIGKITKTQKRQITDVDITGQALIFFFSGFDTVSSLMCFLSYELGIHSEIQKRLQNEIDETFKSCNGKLTYEVLLKMKYLDMVVCESLRKWPNAVAVDRVCTKPYTIQPTTPDERPVHLKKDDVVLLPIFALHRDAQYFPDPDKFDPERFSDENKDKIIPYTYIPFGSGPRNCIGSRFAVLETKLIMFHLLSKFDIIPIEKTQIPLRLCKRQFTLSAEKGFWFGLRRRKIVTMK